MRAIRFLRHALVDRAIGRYHAEGNKRPTQKLRGVCQSLSGWRYPFPVPTAQSDSELTMHGLTGLIIDTHSAIDFAIRGWGQPTRQIQTAIQPRFPSVPPPYMHESF
jgi:hypothetical protein